MRGLPKVGAADTHRVRRWDVVILGGALPGLIAAVRLGQRGARVLIVEEADARQAPPCLREPFLVTGSEPSGVLGGCLRELGVPLIDQRRFATDDVAVQVVTPDARIDLGRSALTASELVAWGLAKPEAARALVRALDEAATAERETLLASPVQRGGRARLRLGGARELGAGPRRDGAVAQQPPPRARGWPREAAEAPERLRHVLDAVTRALSNLGAASPAPEARARLVGGLLAGASVLGGEEGGLLPMIRRRASALFAEFRTLEGPFGIVSVAGQPAVAPEHPNEIWAGRVLVVNAPLPALARVLPEPVRAGLPAGAANRRRFLRRYRGPRSVFPEGMGERVICLPAPTRADGAAPPVVTLRRISGGSSEEDRLVAAAVGPENAPRAEMDAWIDRNVALLMPFAEGALACDRLPDPAWDTDTVLCEPRAGGGGTPASHPLSGRPPIHYLDRGSAGGLGFEGDVLLGWRGADAIADDLP